MKENDAQDEPKVRRRSLLRGGAVLAGAGLAATALAQPAYAEPAAVQLGADNAETTSTQLTVNPTAGDRNVAALRLNNADGPSLYLEPLDETWDGDLKLGEIANTTYGPLIGVQDVSGSSVSTSFLATGLDLMQLPMSYAIPPTRLLDTRNAKGRASIILSLIHI